MKKQLVNLQVEKLLLEIHRGFLTEEQSDGLSDAEVLANVPENKGTILNHPGQGDTSEARVSPFTFRWVKQRVKKNNQVTAYSLLTEAGFKDNREESR